MTKSRYEAYQVQHGQKTLREFMDDLKTLDVLPRPQPAGTEPGTYMCAANMDALMVSNDDGNLVADIAFRNVPIGCPELLGIRRAHASDDHEATREIGKSLILDLLYEAFAPSDVQLLNDNEKDFLNYGHRACLGQINDRLNREACKVFVTRDGNRYEVVRKFMQRPLSTAELTQRKTLKTLIARRLVEQAEPSILTDAEIETANLDAFYRALSGVGVSAVIGHHDVYGENGSRFEGIRAVRRQKLVELPSLEVQHARKDTEGRRGHTFPKALVEVLHDFVGKILSDVQQEFGLFSGTYYRFRCDVALRSVHLTVHGFDLDGKILNLLLER